MIKSEETLLIRIFTQIISMSSKQFALNIDAGKCDFIATSTPPPDLCIRSFRKILNSEHKISESKIPE